MRNISILLCSGVLVWTSSQAVALSAKVFGSFTYAEDSDPLNDEDRSWIYTYSDDENARLSWECEEDGLNIAVETGQVFADKDIIATYRIDKNKAIDLIDWIEAVEGKAIYMPIDAVDEFTLQAIEGSNLVFRTFDYKDNYKTFTFKLKGLKTALEQLDCYNQ